MTMWEPSIADTDAPRYVAIADAIQDGVESGALPEGARLPTHRELAERLGVTVGTVTRGYAEAERRGLTTGEVGRGTFVRSRRDPDGFIWQDAANDQTEGGVVDMSLACPWIPPDGEDGQALSQTLEEISRTRGLDELLTYHPETAHRRHRTVAAGWITDLGLEVSPERIVVTSGAQHGMIVSFSALLRPGDTLLSAEVTYAGMRSVAHMLGLRLYGIPMDDEGITPEGFEAACRDTGARVLYCMPTIQNPTTTTMSAERRERIAEVARVHGVIIVEDEIHVAHGPDALPPVAAFAPERTILVTTLSKWVTFGLRVGFMAAPEHLVERLRSGVRTSLWMPAPLMVEVATRWLADGTAARLGERKLEELTARHEMVRQTLGSFDVRTDPRSLHLWIHLPVPLRADEVVAQARQRGVRIAGAEAFTVGREVPHAVRVSIATAPYRDSVRYGLTALADILGGACEPCSEIL